MENTLECVTCLDNYYFSIINASHHQMQCCMLGNYYDVETDTCKAFAEFPGATFQTQCTKIGVANKECVDCISGWVLNSSMKCVQVPSGCS